MFYYISELNKQNNNNKLNYILNKKNIKYTSNDEYLNIIVKKGIYEYSLYFENYQKPSYILSNTDNGNYNGNYDNGDDVDDNIYDYKIIRKIYEETNNKIDEYDGLESVILDILNKINLHEENKSKRGFIDNKLISIKKKNISEFEKELDNSKENYISKNNSNTILNSGLFSLRSNVEMLGDQILKLHSDSRFNVIIEKFPQIQVLLGKFTFIGSAGLVITIDMDMGNLNLLSEPPKIKISSNKILKDNILKVISELKPFSDIKSWSIKYSIADSIQNIFNMVNTYGEIEHEFTSEFEQVIYDLEYLVSIKNQNISESKLLELFDKELVNTNTQNNNLPLTNNSTNNSTYWKKGTGYGNDKTKKWDINKYIKNVNEKKNKILLYYDKFINKIYTIYGDKDKIDVLSDDSLNRIVNLLINYFQNEEITKNHTTFISIIINNNRKKFESNGIAKFSTLLKLMESYIEENDLTNDFDTFLKSNHTQKITKTLSLETNTNTNTNVFIEMFKSESFKMYSNKFTEFYYKQSININSDKLSRLKKEFNIMKKSILLNSEASMFFWIEKNKLEKMRFIITGPSNTPYDQGLYIFDMTLSDGFPASPPLVHFSNNGGVRFNPNLYNCGKVCLSLLGTWRGDAGESWNTNTSTFFQILVSIQSQILIDEPFFNEPGFEKQIGTANGIKYSKDYNDNIRQYNLDYAINGLIEGIVLNKSHYTEFEYVIKNYFKYKRDRIISILDKWTTEYTNETRKKKFINSKKKFIELSSDL
jgi:ubiquitin-protein ligase